ncbi:hypothetical protein AMAG_12964 [Allomyces macrogynus ATCC 38327]|uniref:Mitochondrial carrier protein n=1 Tax=Allomyces macrogynus (strain ATCC 38327) TaxID=578462 RepID=A0A0L0T0L6_ALLM3|nr:hypothetical protein AMAG_12964 [Allomyces macrogynus ATCC 38327]|eukprot:KNE68297.1 hypothetical protein AMAG_12964 [Allomyces macrogynus ATCC 38327]
MASAPAEAAVTAPAASTGTASTTSASTTARRGMKKEKPWHSFVAGAIGGSVEIAITYPTEFAKTQLQLPGNRFANPVAVLAHHVRTYGPLAIYSGLAPMVAGNAAKAAVRFLAYDAIKVRVAALDFVPRPLVPLLAGLGAGAVEAVTVVTPSETLKTRMVAARNAGTPLAVTAAIREVGGVRGMWRGCRAVVARQAANSAVRFGVYGVLRDKTPSDSPVWAFACGMVAGTVTVYATMPLDVVKTKLQAPGAKASGMWAVATQTVKDDGVKGLWRGATPRLARLVFSGAIVFTVYEQVMRGLRVLDPPRDQE